MALGEGAFELRLRRFAEPLRLGRDQSGIEQLGEMLAERMDIGPRRLGLRSGRLGPRGGFSGGGHEPNMGRIRGWGKGKRRSFATSIGSKLERPMLSTNTVTSFRKGVASIAAYLSGDR